MKKVLVVSDNPVLVQFFQEEFKEQSIYTVAEVTYCYTVVNKMPSEMVSLGAVEINMKDSTTIAKVINGFDVVLSMHCKQIFPPELVSSIPCINVHPGLNPYNRGWYPQVFSIINGKPLGATIHLMDEAIDHGNIIDQEIVKLRASDTSIDLYNRVVEAEKNLIRKNIYSIVDMSFCSNPPVFEGNYNSIADFKSLCKLDLDAIGNLREHINLLRALSHGEYKNAYFFDENGEKIFIRVILEADV